jgi:hypothetical protein
MAHWGFESENFLMRWSETLADPNPPTSADFEDDETAPGSPNTYAETVLSVAETIPGSPDTYADTVLDNDFAVGAAETIPGPSVDLQHTLAPLPVVGEAYEDSGTDVVVEVIEID